MKCGGWRSRRGSALLIVLGMFSFMLVSAVAFSIYMRASRAPSSYVRRNSSARHLAKAALARAMDEIDCAIGNDPFPGVGYNHNYGSSGLNDRDEHKNDNWHGHVFTPSNEIAAVKTVSTLTLEALGYLPPCLIDEARYWSRHSRTAQWHSFNYGMGQYAFTAVNVSDFFELNQLLKEPDSSGKRNGPRRPYLNRNSAPHGRVSPAYLFRGIFKGDMDSGGGNAKAFLDAMENASSFDPPYFVSMMDFNLALGSLGAPGGIASPFFNRINGGTGRFYSGSAGEDIVRRQVFMAGGWNAESNLTYEAYKTAYGDRINLRYPEYQPFYQCNLSPGQTTLTDCYGLNNDFWTVVVSSFPVLSTALLCDYLDYDSVPLSLCIPCIEQVPMVCGVEIDDTHVKCETEYIPGAPVGGGGGATAMTRTDQCNLKIEVEFSPIFTVAYPFVNDRPSILDYEIECYARIFLQEEQVTGDSNLNDSGLRDPLFALNSPDSKWSALNASGTGASYFEVKGSVPLRASDLRAAVKKIAAATGTAREQAALITKKMPKVSIASTTKKLADLTLQQPAGGGAWTLVSVTDPGDINFYPAGVTGTRVSFQTTFAAGATAPYRPMVALWVRIKDSDDKTVDMSPTIPAYDSVNNLAANSGVNGFDLAGGGPAGAPAFRFYPLKSSPGIVPDGRPGGPYDWQGGSPVPVTEDPAWKQKAYIANDPRINWAPEQWWATDQTTDPGQLWLTEVQNFRSADTTRDQDIFMSVSDQGYLQSMYEWMMIPQVRSLTTSSGAEWGTFETTAARNEYDGAVRTSINVAHNNLMWRTYRSDAFGVDSGWGSIDNLPFDEADNGLRVNPYTDIMNVMLGAFANMPRDWWAASTNYLAEGKEYMAPGSSTFEDKYLFDWSCEYEDVYNMAYYWMGAFKRWDQPANEERGKKFFRSDYWKDVFDDALNWRLGTKNYNVPLATSDSDNIDTGILKEDTVEGILKDLTCSERKFLYGYLKGCFANNSQLFLIFVRAESAAGGGGAGSGARAVALVWRDPAAPMDSSGQFKRADGGSESPEYGKDNGRMYLNTEGSASAEEAWRMNERKYPPHKMRVLFYHQLD